MPTKVITSTVCEMLVPGCTEIYDGKGQRLVVAGHVLHQHVGIARNIFSHMRREHKRINIEKVTAWLPVIIAMVLP